MLVVELKLEKTLIHKSIEKLLKHINDWLFYEWLGLSLFCLFVFSELTLLTATTEEFIDPLCLVGAPAELTWGHVDHATSADCGRTGRGQVLHFEEHAHSRGIQLDSLTICQAESAVIVKHRVHVFDPESVYWAVKNAPVALLAGILCHLSDYFRGKTVCPDTIVGIFDAVEFIHADTLWIERP